VSAWISTRSALPLAAVPGHCVTVVSVRVLGKLIPNQSVLALTARTWALQNCMSLIQKTKEVLESGFRILSNLFILNNMAERVGFEFMLIT
jgi:hypothetical protein